MNGYLYGALYRYYRERYFYGLGLFETWDGTIAPTAPYYFGNGYGRAYWDEVKDIHHPELVAAIDSVLTDADAVEFWGTLDERIQRRLDEH
ncbi:MAG: hypothetical protein KJO31_11250 [Gammaproteobacteria bacterium]|nr:hypothetical protein [Gammaproteobacteria bacterium]